jgi:hypothetical protein
MKVENRCKYADECPVYNGTEKVSETPLPIFRNVFCNRGMRGWKNCETFEKFTTMESENIKKKNRDKIDLQNINNPFEKDILMLLNKKEKCIYGEIIRELRISTTKGQEAIYSLLNKGMVRHSGRTSYLELNVELQ